MYFCTFCKTSLSLVQFVPIYLYISSCVRLYWHSQTGVKPEPFSPVTFCHLSFCALYEQRKRKSLIHYVHVISQQCEDKPDSAVAKIQMEN